MENKELINKETNQWWWVEKAKYIPAAPNFSEEKQDNEILDNQIEKAYDTVQAETDTWIQHETIHQKEWWRNQSSEQRGKENPEKTNRIPAGKEFITTLSEPQKKWNILGKAFQWISTKILGTNNL